MTKPKVITFNSAKGGAGKTTICTSMTYLLKDMGFKCLLVDFDLHTNGASYYFSKIIENANRKFKKKEDKYKGICELLDESEDLDGFMTLLRDLRPIEIDSDEIDNNCFYFLPSKTSYASQSPPEFYAKKGDKIQDYFSFLMEHLIETWAIQNENNINYIIVDCPAGCSFVNIPVWGWSDILIAVRENDRISQLANNVLINSIENINRIKILNLFNKIDIFDKKQRIYPDTSDKDEDAVRHNIKGMKGSTISPLPYDNVIRRRFAHQKNPLISSDLKKLISPDLEEELPYPPLLIAIISTMEDIFQQLDDTETVDRIIKYKEEKTTPIRDTFRANTYVLREELEKINNDYNTKVNVNGGKITDKIKSIFEDYDQYVSMLLAYKIAEEARKQ